MARAASEFAAFRIRLGASVGAWFLTAGDVAADELELSGPYLTSSSY